MRVFWIVLSILHLCKFGFSSLETCLHSSGYRIWHNWETRVDDGYAIQVTVPVVLGASECLYCYETSPKHKATSSGLYVAVFNLDGGLWDFRIFRTGESTIYGEDKVLQKYLEDVPKNMVLTVALQGNLGTRDWSPVHAALETAGGLTSSLLRNVRGREAYAFITITGRSDTTQERHVSNPYKMAYVETGYLYVETGGLHFSVNSKVHRSSSQTKGVDFVVVTSNVAHPILQLNANVSTLKPGDKILVSTYDDDWTKAEEKTIATCKFCEINEIRLSEPLRFMHYRMVTPANMKAEVDDLNHNIFLRGYVKDSCDPYVSCDGFGGQCFGVFSPKQQTENEEARATVQSPEETLSFEYQIRKSVIAPDYLYIGDCGSKGRGIFTKTKLQKSSYVVFYHGKRSTEEPECDVSYLFVVTLLTHTVWIDAAEEDGSYGRLMNDDHLNPNLESKIVEVDGQPHVAFFAIRDIEAGEEVRFDYGGDPEGYPWRKTGQSLICEDQIRKNVIAPDYLYIGDSGSKGRGIFTKTKLHKSSYVVFHHGKRYSEEPEGDGTYLFAISLPTHTVWIDAAEEDGSYGRFINDDHLNPNLESQIVVVDGQPHVAYFAIRDIHAGEELVFDYGGDPEGYCWRTEEARATVQSAEETLSFEDQIRKNVVSPDYLYVGDCGSKGRGIFTKTKLQKSSYVVFYHGKRYSEEPEGDDTYLFEVTLPTHTVWIDAAEEDGSYGRLMNDEHLNPNLESEIVEVDGQPHIAFFTIRDIEAGEELVYDYGGDPEGYFWRETEHSVICEDHIRKNVIAPDYLFIGDGGSNGRGIFTKVSLEKSCYVVFYHGKRYTEEPDGDQTYLFEISLPTHNVWIDAAEEDGSYGRLMNDEHLNPNLESEIVEVDGQPHIAFFAIRDIAAGEELVYDYGGDPEGYFWRTEEARATVQSAEETLSFEDQIRKNVVSPDYLYVGDCGSKGRGIFTKTKLQKSSYVVFYHGKRYSEEPEGDDTYLFEVTLPTHTVWIDAAEEDGSYGRLMNDEHLNANLESEIVEVDGQPHIAFFAIRDIAAGKELVYDYGGDPEGYFWRETEHSVICEDHIRKNVIAPDYLFIGDGGSKGRGIFTKISLEKSCYVVFYHGKRYTEEPDGDQTYLFEISLPTHNVWIDAAEEDGSYGRLMNDEHLNPNLESEIVEVDGQPHIAFFAIRDIAAGEELVYDYGGDPEGYFWRTEEARATVQSAEETLSFEDQIRKNVVSPDYLYVGDCGSKGRGIFTKTKLQKSSYVVFYHGKRYSEEPEGDDTYLFEVTLPTHTMWIDAAEEDGSYGRLMNDEHLNPNLESEIVEVDGQPHIAFFAIRDIAAGEELVYDYGGDPEGYFWRETEHSLICEDQIRKNVIAPDYLFIGDGGSKGRGIFTKVSLEKSCYVVFYHGKRYTEEPDGDQTYLFEISLPTHDVWIDAAEEDGSYGRLMNDEHLNPNLESEIVEVDGQPHIAFFAIRDIAAGEELVYDYGGDPEGYFWRETGRSLIFEDQIRKNVIAPDYLYIGDGGSKGRGIFTKVSLEKSSYVVFYHGKRYTKEPDGDQTYLFEISLPTHDVWIDAAEEDGSYGRLMNDDHLNPNLESEIVEVDGQPHIAFFAIRDIAAGEELVYDYGGDPEGYFWRETGRSLIFEDQIRKNVIAPDYLYIGDGGSKGRGIFTKVSLKKSSYVVFYHGKRYTEAPDGDQTYLFEISVPTHHVWIDAAEEDGSYGRLMNDEHVKPNLESEIVEVDGQPHIAFFAIRDIEAGEELVYDYGGDPEGYFWRERKGEI